jgi:dihydrofolate synthase/folylpolyglutamate synthase
MSFIYFSEIDELDYAIIEVGIGGILDTTNIIQPIVSAVTNVSLDHEGILGNTLGQIWDNKLGIVKKEVPFYTISNNEFKNKVIDKCNQVGAPLLLVNAEEVKNIKITTEYTEFDYLDFPAIRLQMLGRHQIENAILAIEICRGIKNLNLSKKDIYNGIAATFWPGRLEVVSTKPLIIIDGSHNVGGITALSDFIEAIKKQHKVRLVFAVSANKNKEAMIALLESRVDEIIFTHFMYKRSDDSLNLFNLSHHANKIINDDIDDIIKLTKTPNEYLNIYCGSLYFISEIRSKF